MEGQETTVMVVTPHPDDAEFGVAGTVALWVRQGRRVVYVVCTDGDKGSSDREMTPERVAQIRRAEQMEAAKVLGVSEVVFLGYPDGGLEDTPEFRGDLVRLIRKYRPDVVVTADPYRKYLWHRDHRIAGRVTLDAVFPYARDHLSYPEHLAEGLEPHKVREVYLWASEEPNTHIDISETFETKLAALGCHTSQVGHYMELIRQRVSERATKMGEEGGIPLAEAFYRIEIVF
ncbi:MAG: PIG-L deacetylase family protein [Chloroflexota bacterium]|nr:PIG-L deacetylase family protein [Chloroflexota bacterium]